MLAVSSIQVATVHVWDHSGMPLRVTTSNPKIRKAMTIRRDKEKMLTNVHFIYRRTNLIYKRLVQSAWEEDLEKILVHEGW